MIDRTLEASAIVKQVFSITSDRPVDVTVDAIGGPSTESLSAAVASHWHENSGEKGLLVSCLPQSSESLKDEKGIKLATILALSTLPWNQALFTTLYHDVLYGWLKDGSIKVK